MSPVDNLIKKTFGEGLWNFTIIFDSPMQGLSTITTCALVFGFLLFTLQVAIDAFRFGGKSEELNEKCTVHFIWFMLLAALLKTPGYLVAVESAIAKPAEVCAVVVSLVYVETFNKKTQEVLSVYGKSKSKPWSFLTATVKGGVLIQLLAGLVYVITSALIFVIPVLQIRLFEFMVYIGPICLIFSLCEWTRSVAFNWLNLTLTMAWMAFIASVSVLIFVNSGVLDKIAVSATWEDLIPVLVYGILSIVLLLIAFPISSKLFNSIGSGLGKLAGGGAAVAATAGGIGVAAVGMGAVGKLGGSILQKSSNTTLQKMGGAISNISNAVTTAGYKYGTPGAGMVDLANGVVNKMESRTGVPTTSSVPDENSQDVNNTPGKGN